MSAAPIVNTPSASHPSCIHLSSLDSMMEAGFCGISMRSELLFVSGKFFSFASTFILYFSFFPHPLNIQHGIRTYVKYHHHINLPNPAKTTKGFNHILLKVSAARRKAFTTGLDTKVSNIRSCRIGACALLVRSVTYSYIDNLPLPLGFSSSTNTSFRTSRRRHTLHITSTTPRDATTDFRPPSAIWSGISFER
jgi:hypothetical protein